MAPDLEDRVPREILEALIQEGTEAFRKVLEKLLNLAMGLERSEFLGSRALRENEPATGPRQRLQGQEDRHACGRTPTEDPSGARAVVLPSIAGEGLPLGKGAEVGHCRDVCHGRLNPQGQ